MASTPLSVSSSSALIDCTNTPRRPTTSPSQCVTLSTLPPPLSPPAPARTAAYSRKIARNVIVTATGEAPAEVVADSELPKIINTIQEAWEKVEDKYAVSSLAVAGVIALWGSTGMVSAIDRLPLVPGVLELVGIGYTGWFAYKNLFFKPDRQALIQKIKDTYKDVVGTAG